MTEYRLFPEGETPYVSTYEFHKDRERARHLEQPVHRDRLYLALDFIQDAVDMFPKPPDVTISDFGCGDGGLLSLLKDMPHTKSWGYDFQPTSQLGWAERGVNAYPLDVFGKDRHKVEVGEVVVCTEVLEHLADPHEVVEWLAGESLYLVASSPHTETDASHDECHAWAWDMQGYRNMLRNAGFKIIRHETVGMFQVILGEVL